MREDILGETAVGNEEKDDVQLMEGKQMKLDGEMAKRKKGGKEI